MCTKLIAFLASAALLACSADPGEPGTQPTPEPSAAPAAAQQASGSAQDSGTAKSTNFSFDGLPKCEDAPEATRCVATSADGWQFIRTSGVPKSNAPTRWWENRDAGSCVSSIPVYGPGDCDCNALHPSLCGDGCSPTGEVVAFCVCGGLKEEKRAATWEIPGFAARYPNNLCHAPIVPDGGN